jgi:hypothetical protein
MMGREVTDWISRARVTGERQSLATAAAEILKPPRTTGARLPHPVSAPEGTEGGLTVSKMPSRTTFPARALLPIMLSRCGLCQRRFATCGRPSDCRKDKPSARILGQSRSCAGRKRVEEAKQVEIAVRILAARNHRLACSH